MAVTELADEVLAAATALGVVSSGSLNHDFFSDPLGKLRSIVSNAEQRSALLTALDALLPPPDDLAGASDSASTTTRHPIVRTAHGALALSITRSGSSSDPTVVIGLWGTAKEDVSGCAIEVDIPLVCGADNGATVVVGTAAAPIAVSVDVPVGLTRPDSRIGLAAVRLSAVVVVTPDITDSRVLLDLSGLDVGAGPQDLVLDPLDLGGDLSRVLSTLLMFGLEEADPGDAGLAQLVAHLPSVLGLGGSLPELPIGALIADAGAFRTWIASLLTAEVDGRPALLAWLDAIGQLLAAPALAAGLTDLPGPADPVRIPIVDGGPAGFFVALEAFVDTPTGSATPDLHLSVSAGISGDLAGVHADAELLVVPLGGNTPTRTMTSAQLVVESIGPLWPPAGQVDTLLQVGQVRGGLRYDGTAVRPVLELDGVHVELPGVVAAPITFDRLDLTQAKTLASAASDTVLGFLTDQLGTGIGASVLGLIGLSGTPTSDYLGAFANDPLRAIGALHRSLLDTHQYAGMAQQIAGMFGGSTTFSATDGTAANPWLIDFTDLPVSAEALLKLQLAIWDAPSGADHEIHLALRLATPDGGPPTSWSVALSVDLMTFALPHGGAARTALLGGVDLSFSVNLPVPVGAMVTAQSIRVTGSWSPGTAFQVSTTIDGVQVTVDGVATSVGSISLPGGLTESAMSSAWPAVRALLDRAAAGWGGSIGAAVSGLLGLGPEIGGLPSNWPTLALPAGGVRALLDDPLEMLRGRLADLVGAGVTTAGEVAFHGALRLVLGLLGGRLPAQPSAAAPPLPIGPQLAGSGTYDDPWAIPLTDSATPLVAEPIELIAWLEPRPPVSWAAAALGLLQADDPDVVSALGALGGWVDSAWTATAGLAQDDLTSWLSAVAAAVDGTDGIVSTDQSDALPAGVAATDPIGAAHHLLPQAPAAVTATVAHLQAHAAGAPVVLVAPSFAPGDVWAPLLAASAGAVQVQVDLRQAGVDPGLVDLTGVATGTHYLVNLADDGTPTLSVLVARLDRVVQRVITLTGSATIALVGHSIGGIAAVAYAGAHSTLCKALVTLAAPFSPLDPTESFAGDVASGVRLVRALAPAGLTSAPILDAALAHLAAALDGCSSGGPAPYPAAAFARTLPTVDLSAVPTLAIPAGLDASVSKALAADLASSTSSTALVPPTHLAWGFRAGIDVGSTAGPAVDLRARFDVGRIRLVTGAADPAHPRQRILMDALISDPSGWLVGSSGTGAPLDARLRAARMTLAHTTGVGTDFDVAFYDGSIRGVGQSILGLSDVQSAELLHGLVSALAQSAVTDTSASALLNLLQSIGLVSFDASANTATVYGDSLTALIADPDTWFSTRLPGAIDDIAGVLGLVADAPIAGQPRTWHRTLGTLPIELLVSDAPWTIGLRTTGTGLDLGAGAGLTVSVLQGLSGTSSIDAAVTAVGITLDYASSGGLTLSVPSMISPVTLLPRPTAGELADALIGPLALTGLSAAVTGALRDAVGGALPVGSITQLLTDAAHWLALAGHLGDSSSPAGTFSPAGVTRLLGAVGAALGLTTANDGSVQIADGLSLAATAAAGGGVALALKATGLALAGADGPTLTLDAGIQIAGPAHQVTPSGTAGLSMNLGAGWGTFGITVSESATGFGLSITPGTGTLELLPTFGGLWDLINAGVQALLPGVLDALVQRLSNPTPPLILTKVLAVADSLNLRKSDQTFDSAALAGLVDSVAAGTFAPSPHVLADVVGVLLPVGSPVTVSGSSAPPALNIDITTLPGGLSGQVHLSANVPGGGSAPDLGVHLQALGLGPVVLDVSVAQAGGRLGVTASIGVDLSDDIGFDFAPSLSLTDAAGQLSVTLQPLGASSALVIDLAPTPGISPDRTHLADLVTSWAVPVLARVALDKTSGLLQKNLWAGGPTVLTLLQAATLVRQTGAGLRPVNPLPTPAQIPHDIIGGLLGGFGSIGIPITSTLSLDLYSEGATWLGVGASGRIDIPIGDLILSVLLGSPDITEWADPKPGLGVLLFDDSSALALRPGVRLGGVGLRLAKNSGALVDTSEIRINAIRAMVQGGVDLTGSTVAVAPPPPGGTAALRGGLELEQVGMPLGAGSQPSNAVAGSLLQPSGQSGDDQPANPPADLFLLLDDLGNLAILINGKDGSAPFYLDVHKVFGPLHIDRVGLAQTTVPLGSAIGALIDGGVSIAGLTVDVQGLELDIPLKAPADMSQWRVDLAGLAASFVSGPLSIAGGLLKTTASGAIEYRGELAVDVGSFGLTALGAYSQLTDSTGSFTSMFVYVLINAPIGGPPYLFITGLSGGAGYNRQLVVPSDPSTIATFPLLQVMGSAPPTDPMSTLTSMSAAMPARRGSYWVAAGVTFTTFELLNTKAMAYVALDRGFEVGLIGLMTMALPAPDAAIVSVELALSARYSSSDELLAIRAQLTNNSWLISRDCQLTGGFAFYAWFGDSPQVLLTIGGFGPYWQVTPGDPHASQYPVVPPVGFHWAVGGGIVVKGESYFALTPHQLAFGGRLEATYSGGPIKVWFMVWLDVELEWDPMHYHFDAGVSIGASFTLTIDLFFGSITISISISLGAAVVVDGPPLHGTVTVELEVASVTVQFGTSQPPGFLGWNDFAAKYAAITPGTDSTRGAGTSLATVASGQLADSTQQTGSNTAPPSPDGSSSSPWQVLPEFGLTVISKTPLTSTSFAGQIVVGGGYTGVFDLAPTGSPGDGFQSSMTVTIELWNTQTSTGTDESGISAQLTAVDGHFPISVWVPNPAPDTSAVSSSPTMTKAMSGVSMAFPVVIAPASEPPVIPISTLVQDDPGSVRSLPFGAPALLAHPTIPAPRSAPAARTEPVLQAILHPAALSIRGHRLGTPSHTRLTELAAGAGSGHDLGMVLRPAELHLWRRGARDHFRGYGSGCVRVTSLSPVGRVIDDRFGPAEETSFELDAHAETVAVSAGPAASGPWGWSRATTLQQVGKATALGPGCTMLLPRPTTAPTPHPVQRSVRAAALLADLNGVTTVLPAATSTVVVVLDRTPGVGIDDLVLSSTQLVLEQRIVRGARQLLVHRVIPTGEPVTVTVASARSWHLDAVYGTTDPARLWAERLIRDPYYDVLAAAAPEPDAAPVAAGRPVHYRFNTTSEVVA